VETLHGAHGLCIAQFGSNWLSVWVGIKEVPYILKSNPHPFYSFRGLKNQMRIRFAVESWILEK
jgi:hypothetical protein